MAQMHLARPTLLEQFNLWLTSSNNQLKNCHLVIPQGQSHLSLIAIR